MYRGRLFEVFRVGVRFRLVGAITRRARKRSSRNLRPRPLSAMRFVLCTFWVLSSVQAQGSYAGTIADGATDVPYQPIRRVQSATRQASSMRLRMQQILGHRKVVGKGREPRSRRSVVAPCYLLKVRAAGERLALHEGE
jgi:hypothetical protein